MEYMESKPCQEFHHKEDSIPRKKEGRNVKALFLIFYFIMSSTITSYASFFTPKRKLCPFFFGMYIYRVSFFKIVPWRLVCCINPSFFKDYFSTRFKLETFSMKIFLYIYILIMRTNSWSLDHPLLFMSFNNIYMQFYRPDYVALWVLVGLLAALQIACILWTINELGVSPQ